VELAIAFEMYRTFTFVVLSVDDDSIDECRSLAPVLSNIRIDRVDRRVVSTWFRVMLMIFMIATQRRLLVVAAMGVAPIGVVSSGVHRGLMGVVSTAIDFSIVSIK